MPDAELWWIHCTWENKMGIAQGGSILPSKLEKELITSESPQVDDSELNLSQNEIFHQWYLNCYLLWQAVLFKTG